MNKKKDKIIFIINLSLDRKGSLNIFHQVLNAIIQDGGEYTYYVFCRLNEMLEFQSEKIKIELLSLSRIERFFFETYYLINWSKKNKINADLVISLQNTSIKYLKDVPQIILFQQSIPLSNFKWNIFKKDERQMFFYKNIYPFFVRRYINYNTTIVAPTKWVQNAIIEKWKLRADQVLVIYSQLREIDTNKIVNIKIDNSKYHIFYPSNSAPHKNHRMILSAMNDLKESNLEIYNKTLLHLTINPNDSKDITKLVNKYNLHNHVLFEGEIDYYQVLAYYKTLDLLVFPSFIESFGLPLIEAASFGIPIIASNLPYAREVLSNYEGVKYADFTNSKTWALAIIEAFNLKLRFSNYSLPYDSNWSDFMKVIKEKLN